MLVSCCYHFIKNWTTDIFEFSNHIHLSIRPSDSDFPFELRALHFTLIVPPTYPPSPADDPDDIDEISPSIIVTNADIPRGFALNIEDGFADKISKPGMYSKSLVDMIKELDSRLEEFLSAEKRETYKILNTSKRAEKKKEEKEYNAYEEWGIDSNFGHSADEPVPEKTDTVYTESQLQESKARREREIKQFLLRLPSAKIVRTSTDDNDPDLFSVPFAPLKKSSLPSSLSNLSTFTMVVPKLYPLKPCEVMTDVSADSETKCSIENGFKAHAADRTEFSLFAHANFFVQNAGLLVETGCETSKETTHSSEDEESAQEEYRNPPEWDRIDDYDDDDDDNDVEFDYEGNDFSDTWNSIADEDPANLMPRAESPLQEEVVKQAPPANATSINLPGVKLINVAVLQCTLLSLVVKCTRCKTDAEICDIKPHGPQANGQYVTCGKCSGVLSVASFSTEFVHTSGPGAERLGYIDLLGCTAADILPSSFRPTCAECSEPVSGNGIAGLGIAQTMSTNCRNCHTKLSIFIPSVKFSRVSDETGHTLTSRKIPKAKHAQLGVVAGSPLPLNGTCQHYRRSTRWFRFSCCNRVFPCDKCHDEHSDHVNEHANRMICGMCSREQNYKPDMCAYCRHSFFRKSTGFWEGGMGTRDKTKMSRKDPRKYKRR